MAKFRVMREHHGDRFYARGETREADAGTVRHLVERGVLEPLGDTAAESKAEPAPRNKAIKAPRNKAP